MAWEAAFRSRALLHNVMAGGGTPDAGSWHELRRQADALGAHVGWVGTGVAEARWLPKGDPELLGDARRDLAASTKQCRRELACGHPARALEQVERALGAIDVLWRRAGFPGCPGDQAEAARQGGTREGVEAALALRVFGRVAAGALRGALAAAVRAAHPAQLRTWPLMGNFGFHTAVTPKGVVAVALHDRLSGPTVGTFRAKRLDDAPDLTLDPDTLRDWHAFLRHRFNVAEDGATFAMPLRTAVCDSDELLGRWMKEDLEILDLQLRWTIERHASLIGVGPPAPIGGQRTSDGTPRAALVFLFDPLPGRSTVDALFVVEGKALAVRLRERRAAILRDVEKGQANRPKTEAARKELARARDFLRERGVPCSLETIKNGYRLRVDGPTQIVRAEGALDRKRDIERLARDLISEHMRGRS